DQARPAEGALAEVDEVEVGHEPVLGRVHRHRRDGDAVGERDAAHTEGDEHGWRRAALRSPILPLPLSPILPPPSGPPALVAFEPFAVAEAEVLVADALGAREEA